jgi:hypothetical protein
MRQHLALGSQSAPSAAPRRQTFLRCARPSQDGRDFTGRPRLLGKSKGTDTVSQAFKIAPLFPGARRQAGRSRGFSAGSAPYRLRARVMKPRARCVPRRAMRLRRRRDDGLTFPQGFPAACVSRLLPGASMAVSLKCSGADEFPAKAPAQSRSDQ